MWIGGTRRRGDRARHLFTNDCMFLFLSRVPCIAAGSFGQGIDSGIIRQTPQVRGAAVSLFADTLSGSSADSVSAASATRPMAAFS